MTRPAVHRASRAVAHSLSKQRLRLWIRLLRTSRAIETELRAKLRADYATTLPQFDVLATLARAKNGMTMTDLSRALMVSNGNVTGIIDRLVAERYVVRHAPVEDRRSFIVRLTAKGAAYFATIAAAHEEWIDTLLSDFGGDELESLIGRFDGLAERIRGG